MRNFHQKFCNAAGYVRKTNFDPLHDLVFFLQFKKREKHPWGSVTFSTKSNTLPWVFFTFLKLYKWYQIVQRITTMIRLDSPSQ